MGKSIDCEMEIRWGIVLEEKSQIAATGSYATFGPGTQSCLVHVEAVINKLEANISIVQQRIDLAEDFNR